MRQKSVLLLQQVLLALLLGSLLILSSCSDECESTITYTRYEPVYMMKEELRSSVKMEPSRNLRKPGKIYAYENFLFINELEEGIHVLDNSDPAAPRPLSFISIPGNIDLAVKGHTLYADNYIDLVVFDVANPQDIKLLNRVENVFPVNGMTISLAANSFVAKYEAKTVTEPYSTDCNGNPNGGIALMGENASNRHTYYNASASVPGGSQAGKGGSMARFTITGNHLYTVSTNALQTFNITDQTKPVPGQKIDLPWGIETIFPYQNKLFIGSNAGMHIYDNSNPAAPVHLSTYQHVRSCDPVVVEGDLAWVTLRSGNTCAGFTNQLEVINISDPRNPKLIKTYPMQNPHGLGIDQSLLFLCEGEFGLKVFDIKDPMQVANNQLKHYPDQDAFDVIPLGYTLLMVGKDGLYQFDYRNPAQIKLLSKIPVVALN